MTNVLDSLLLSLLFVLGSPTDTQLAMATIAVALLAVAFLSIALRVNTALPSSDVRSVFARHGAGRAPTPVQSDPDAPGHARPRAPGLTVATA